MDATVYQQICSLNHCIYICSLGKLESKTKVFQSTVEPPLYMRTSNIWAPQFAR